jgi:ABC-2 type transport system permease protein
MLLKQAMLIARKDLRIFFADRGALAFAVIFPLVAVFGFSSLFGTAYSAKDVLMPVRLATAEGPESISQAIIDALAAEGHFAVTQQTPGEASDLVQRGKLGGYLAFPAGFAEAVIAGRQTTVEVHLGPEGNMAGGVLDSIARTIAGEINGYTVSHRAAMDLASRFGGPDAVQRLAALLAAGFGAPLAPGGGAGGGTVSPVVVTETQVGRFETKSPANMILPGYLTMFVFFALALSAEALIGERENFTLDRLVASRATRSSILLGKYLGNVFKGTVQAAILWGAGILLFRIDPGYAPWAAFAVTFAVVLCAAGLGLALATVAKTRNGAGSIAVFASLTMAPLGGCWFPLWMMPAWMQAVAKITPHAWANSAFAKLLLFAASPSAVLLEVLALLGFAAAFCWVAVAKFSIEA